MNTFVNPSNDSEHLEILKYISKTRMRIKILIMNTGCIDMVAYMADVYCWMEARGNDDFTRSKAKMTVVRGVGAAGVNSAPNHP